MSEERSAERDVTPVREVLTIDEWRVTYEGNDYADTFPTEPEALAWAAQWKSPVIDKRTVVVTTETSTWTRVLPPA